MPNDGCEMRGYGFWGWMFFGCFLCFLDVFSGWCLGVSSVAEEQQDEGTGLSTIIERSVDQDLSDPV